MKYIQVDFQKARHYFYENLAEFFTGDIDVGFHMWL